MQVTEEVFRWSTPAKIDGKRPKPWRVSDASAMRSVLDGAGYPDKVAYVEYAGRTGLHVGIRDNRDPVSHAEAVEELCKLLCDLGFDAKSEVREGRAAWVLVKDSGGANHEG